MAQVWLATYVLFNKCFQFSPRISLDTGIRQRTKAVAAAFWPQRDLGVSKKADKRQPSSMKY